MICDFHSHLIPGVDDGAANLEESRAALSALAAQGVAGVLTTPHMNAEITLHPPHARTRLLKIDEHWKSLAELARTEFPSLKLFRGAEIMLDVPRPDLSDARLRLNGTRFVLLEFPGMTVPPNSPAVLSGLIEKGYMPIVAHPERYAGIASRLGLVDEWVKRGCFLQLNTGSLVNHYGQHARRAAFEILKLGLASYLSSDYHARGRPSIAAAVKTLESAGGTDQIRLLTVTNPRRMFDDLSPEPVAPLAPRSSLWVKLRKSFLSLSSTLNAS